MRPREAWETWVLPTLIEKACRSRVILEERRRLVPQARGHVLEIGVGSGLNLPFYDAAEVARLTAIDPSEALLARARQRASESPVGPKTTLLQAGAEQLPLEDASVDSAVMTYTLCSVTRPDAVLGELRRVLRPGGPLYFVEHGLADTPVVARLQRGATPLWRRCSGNCHLDRDAETLLRQAGFELSELHRGFTDGAIKALSYTYEGTARRPG